VKITLQFIHVEDKLLGNFLASLILDEVQYVPELIQDRFKSYPKANIEKRLILYIGDEAYSINDEVLAFEQ
jgi:hypothetical protein